MIKIIICILIIGFCVIGASVLTQKYRRRKRFFYDFLLFNERYINEMSYTKTPLFDFFDKYKYRDEFSGVMDVYRANGNVDKHLTDEGYVTEDDLQFTKDYFSLIGRSDCTSQLAFAKSAQTDISALKKLAADNYDKYVGAYYKLAVALGLLIVIFLY